MPNRPVESRQRKTRIIAISKDGAGTPTISGMCSLECSITDTGVGDYLISFNEILTANDYIANVTSRTSDVYPKIGTKLNGSIQVLGRSLATAEQTAVLSLEGIKFHSLLQGADGNDVTIQITGGATAGSEVITSTSAGAITIQVEDGVSTATQVVAALKALTTGVVSAFVGYELITGATVWDIAAAANLAGGVNIVAEAAAEMDFDLLVFVSETADADDRYNT